MVKPYTIIKTEKTNNSIIEIRLFENFNSKDLFWHRDKEDRLITVLEGFVTFQLEDELPVYTKEIFIPKETFHRVIADSRFVLQVEKYI